MYVLSVGTSRYILDIQKKCATGMSILKIDRNFAPSFVKLTIFVIFFAFL